MVLFLIADPTLMFEVQLQIIVGSGKAVENTKLIFYTAPTAQGIHEGG